MQITYPKILGSILLILSLKIASSLAQGIPSSGINYFVTYVGIPAQYQYNSAMAGSALLLLLAVVFSFRALLFNKVCIGEQCAIKRHDKTL